MGTREEIKKEIGELLDLSNKIWGLFSEENKTKKQVKTDFVNIIIEYQNWYTRALAVIKQLIPDRLSEFEELYISKIRRKDFNSSNYTINDYLIGITVTRKRGILEQPEPVFNTRNVFASKFSHQIAILNSAYSRIDAILSDITGVLQAELFDSELEKASELLKAGYSRAAGTMASVVLESHLSYVCSKHSITFRKKPFTYLITMMLLKIFKRMIHQFGVKSRDSMTLEFYVATRKAENQQRMKSPS